MAGTLNAYVDEALVREATASGPLSETTFAVKDLFDVAGTTAQCGNPDWGRTHAPAERDAWAVAALRGAGAKLRGKTITDEFAFSIIGENPHFGTPVNPNAPGRTCGGSSSGSAAAVAGGLADFALGTDTGGSVRVPASFCGIFGLRPTHGRVNADGVFPLAPSLDTVGWFARDPRLMQRIGSVLLDTRSRTDGGGVRLLYPIDAWEEAQDDARACLTRTLEGLERHLGPAEPIRLTEGEETLSDWFEVFRTDQGAEIWETLGPWIEAEDPAIGPDTRARLEFCAGIGAAARHQAAEARAGIAARIGAFTRDGGLLVLPAAPGAAVETGLSGAELIAMRGRIIRLSGIAPLAGVPQISLPLARIGRLPIALSVMGAPGSDERLLDLAQTLCGPAEGGLAPLLQASN